MVKVKRYASRLEAQQAAEYLSQHGVAARVVGDHVHALLHAAAIPWFQVDLVIASRDDLDEARRLLAEYEALPPIDDGDDWERQALPDLGALGSEAEFACPHCAHTLPPDAALDACPSCAADIDMLDIAVRTVGVDRMRACFEDETVLGFLLRYDSVRCAGCGYDLTGLPLRGRCPECGGLFERGGDA